MNKKITPVNKYALREAILSLPGVWVCKKGFYISVKDLNNTIDDLSAISKEELVDYILQAANKASKTPIETSEIKDLNELLTYNEVREYVGMKPLNGYDEFLEV